MPVFKIHHVTRYEYNLQVKESVNEIRIAPYQCAEQEVLQQNLLITGHPTVHAFADYWGNWTGTFNLLAPHQELVIDNQLVVRTLLPDEVALPDQARLADLEGAVSGNLRLLELSKPDLIQRQEAVEDIIATVCTEGRGIAAIAENSCAYIYQNFQYVKGITNTETTVDEILEHRGGVCQDFAHVLLQLLRTLTIPSRYVSGYICPNENGMRGEGATHAWVEVWIPGYGWAGIDPTNNVWVTNKHVKLAVGRNFNDCSPVKGTFKGTAAQRLSVVVSIGYEDGKTFEALNDVRPRHGDPAPFDSMAEQSQQ